MSIKRTLHVRVHVCVLLVALVPVMACGGSGATNKRASAPASDAGNPFANSHVKVGASDALSAHDGGDGSTAEPTCGASPFAAAPANVNMLLVIDKSGSMHDTPAHFDTDKWSAMKASIAAALTPLKNQARLGLELYPLAGCDLPTGGGVDVGVEAGDKALPLVTKALANADPSGGTPTAAALARALDYFTKGAGAKLDGGKYVLLATDGGPNCDDSLSCEPERCTTNIDGDCPKGFDNCCDPMSAGAGAQAGCLDDDGTLARVRALEKAGIDTFVVGIPGSEAYADALDALAEAGGRASQNTPKKYFQVSASGSDTSGLTSVIQTITSGLIMTCRLQLGSTPPALDRLNVEIDGAPVPQQSTDGWDLDTTTMPPTIELKGKTCQHVEHDGAQSVKVTFGCPTVVD